MIEIFIIFTLFRDVSSTILKTELHFNVHPYVFYEKVGLSQNSQENTCAGVSFSRILRASRITAAFLAIIKTEEVLVLQSFWRVAAHEKITKKRYMMKFTFVEIVESSTGSLDFFLLRKISQKIVPCSKKRGNCIFVCY